MGNQVDERIVEMKFNNKDFEKGVSASMQTITNLKNGLDFKGSVKAIGDLSSAFKQFTVGKVEESVDKLNSKFSLLGITAFSVLNKLASATIDWTKQIIGAVTGMEAAMGGLQEYETQINAIQTIMANTDAKGTTLDQVMTALKELNDYADLTIYNFTEMTKNIGTFTAAGIDLDTSVAGIKGIANLAAVSGSSAVQASTAMYQLSQAISTGTVRLQDWNSVSTAGMGGDIFQKALVDTARVHGIAIDDMIEKEGTFRASLATNWLSSEILLETLSKFTGDLSREQVLQMGYTEEQADEIIRLGEVSRDAATKIKTFTQLVGALKETAVSGWVRTWELIIGNFGQAKELFSGVNDVLGAYIGASADARNSILQSWNDLGGRDQLINSIGIAFKLLLKVLMPISEAMREVFPAVTGEQLFKLTVALKVFLKNLEVTEPFLATVKSIFKGLFSAIALVGDILIAVGKAFIKLLSPLSMFNDGIFNGIGSIGDWITQLRETAKATNWFGTQLDKVVDFIHTLVQWAIIGVLALNNMALKLKAFLDPHITKLLSRFQGNFVSISDYLVSFGQKFTASFNAAYLAFKTLDSSGIIKFFDNLKLRFMELTGQVTDATGGLSPFAKTMQTLKPILDAIGKAAATAFTWLKELVMTGASKIDLSAIFASFDEQFFDDLSAGLSAGFKTLMSAVSGGLLIAISMGFKDFMSKGSDVLSGISEVLEGVGGALEAWQNNLKAQTLMEIAKAIAVIAISVIALTFVDPVDLAISTGAITLLMNNLMGAMASFSKMGGGRSMVEMTAALVGIAAAMLILSISLVILSKIDWPGVNSGLAALAGVALILIATSRLLSKNAYVFGEAAKGLVLFSLGLLAMAVVVRIIGGLDDTAMGKGLLVLAAVIAEIVLFSRTIGDGANLKNAAVAMLGIAAAMLVLSIALQRIGSIDDVVLGKGLTAMAASLSMFLIALRYAGTNTLENAAAIAVLSASLVILAYALEKLGNLEWEQIAKGLTSIAGSLAIMVLALKLMQNNIMGAYALGIASVGLLALAFALKILSGVPAEALGIALLAIVGVFALFALAAMLLGPTIPVMTALGISLLLFSAAALAFGLGVLALSSGIGTLVALGAAGIALFALFVTTFVMLLPLIVEQLGLAFIEFLKTAQEAAPMVIDILKIILIGILTTISETMPAFQQAMIDLLAMLCQVLIQGTPGLIDAGWTIVKSLFKGLRDNIGPITEIAIEALVLFIDSVTNKLGDIIESGTKLGIEFINGISSNSKRFADAGFDAIIQVIDGIAASITENSQALRDSTKRLGTAIIDGLLGGIDTGAVFRVISRIKQIGSEILDALKLALGIHSPSKPAIYYGEMTMQGLINGISGMVPDGVKSAANAGKKVLTSFTDAISSIADSINSDFDLTPTIRPVIDLSGVAEGKKAMDGMLSKSSSLRLYSSVSRAKLAGSSTDNTVKSDGINSTSNQTVSFVQNNYSPEALSRIEIYRQTKNQLAQLKGLLGTT